MDNEQDKLKKIVEGAIFASDRPLSIDKLKDLFYLDDQPSTEQLQAAIEALQQDYAEHGVELRELANGYRFQVRSEYGQWISRLWDEKPAKYSRALLETLALIAYRQPITRGEIEEIRGVSVSTHITKTLLERDWIRVVGHRDVPGRPAMYATTKLFLDYFNMQSLDELPSLAEIRDLDKINEELELVEKNADADASIESGDEEPNEAQEDTSGNNLQTDATEGDSNNRKSKVTLHDLAEKMARLRDTSDLDETESEQEQSDSVPVDSVDDVLVVTAEGPAASEQSRDAQDSDVQDADEHDAEVQDFAESSATSDEAELQNNEVDVGQNETEPQQQREAKTDQPELLAKQAAQEPEEQIETESSVFNNDL